VNAGDTITWKNEDIVPHIVTGDKLKSKSMDQGESWTYTAKRKGDFPYNCRFHPTMKGVLIVLCLAKTPSGHEINSLHNFLNPPICYDCSLCSDFSVSGWEQSSGFCDHGRTCSWRTSHFVSSSVYSSVETGGPNWPSSISSSGL